eukprot:5693179-Prymnesium_polylepis.1
MQSPIVPAAARPFPAAARPFCWRCRPAGRTFGSSRRSAPYSRGAGPADRRRIAPAARDGDMGAGARGG